VSDHHRREAIMKRAVTIAALLVSLLGLAPVPAQAGAAASAALGLSAFAVFNQILAGIGLFGFPWAYAAPAYYPPYSYPYASPGYAPVSVQAAPAPAAAWAPAQGEVVYPHGRYVLTGNGASVAYRWVWVPNPPPGQPPAPPGR
jgi:hypothetical protein